MPKIMYKKEEIGGSVNESNLISHKDTTVYNALNNIDNEIIQTNQNLIELKILGWNVPSECPIQNEISGNSFIQKVGRVDLGSLDYTYYTSGANPCFYPNSTIGAKDASSSETVLKAYCSKYENIGHYITRANFVASATNDKHFSIMTSDGRPIIMDKSITSASAFKTAMSGVCLYFELATPITHSIADENAVTKLNDSLNNLITTLTATSNIKWLSGGYIKVGRVVQYHIGCNANVTFTADTPMLSGLPKPLTSYVAVRIFDASSADYFDGYIDTDGALKFRDRKATAFPSSNHALYITGSYISAS